MLRIFEGGDVWQLASRITARSEMSRDAWCLHSWWRIHARSRPKAEQLNSYCARLSQSITVCEVLLAFWVTSGYEANT